MFHRSKPICIQCHSKPGNGCFTILFDGAYFLLAVMVEGDDGRWFGPATGPYWRPWEVEEGLCFTNYYYYYYQRVGGTIFIWNNLGRGGTVLVHNIFVKTPTSLCNISDRSLNCKLCWSWLMVHLVMRISNDCIDLQHANLPNKWSVLCAAWETDCCRIYGSNPWYSLGWKQCLLIYYYEVGIKTCAFILKEL